MTFAKYSVPLLARYSYHTEDNIRSEGYPGLNTLYCVHQARQQRQTCNQFQWQAVMAGLAFVRLQTVLEIVAVDLVPP